MAAPFAGGDAAPPTLSENPTRALYGGAMSVAVPCTFNDVSDFREVPDHQEVFADAERDASVIVEINEFEEVKDGEAAEHHMRDYAAAAGCAPEDVAVELTQELSAEDVPGLADAPGVHMVGIVALQRIAKFKEGDAAKNCVRVFMAVLRLPHVRSDILLIVNTPVEVSAASSSFKALEEIPDADDALALFKDVMRTFTVHNWAIFPEGG